MDKLETVQRILRFSESIRNWCEQNKMVFFDDFDNENIMNYDEGGYGKLADMIIEKGIQEGLIDEEEGILRVEPTQIYQLLLPRLARGPGQEAGNDLGISAGVEGTPPLLQLAAQLPSVDDIAVMSQGQLHLRPTHEDGLSILSVVGTCGGVASMPYSYVS